MAKSTREILVDASALVARGWTRGAYGRDAEGESMDLPAEDATCLCAVGALRSVAGATHELVWARDRLCEAIGSDHLVDWDADVLAAFDRAIAALD